jgi:hypothetical protein
MIRPEEAAASGPLKKGDQPLIAKGLPMTSLIDTLIELIDKRNLEN